MLRYHEKFNERNQVAEFDEEMYVTILGHESVIIGWEMVDGDLIICYYHAEDWNDGDVDATDLFQIDWNDLDGPHVEDNGCQWKEIKIEVTILMKEEYLGPNVFPTQSHVTADEFIEFAEDFGSADLSVHATTIHIVNTDDQYE
jgi:hypothetical protein